MSKTRPQNSHELIPFLFGSLGMSAMACVSVVMSKILVGGRQPLPVSHFFYFTINIDSKKLSLQQL